MPRISSFYGIVIWMYWNDHNPPHFHATYGDYEVLINIPGLSIYTGFLPAKDLWIINGMGIIEQTTSYRKLGINEKINSINQN